LSLKGPLEIKGSDCIDESGLELEYPCLVTRSTPATLGVRTGAEASDPRGQGCVVHRPNVTSDLSRYVPSRALSHPKPELFECGGGQLWTRTCRRRASTISCCDPTRPRATAKYSEIASAAMKLSFIRTP
jgi:hypothetical protein